MTNNFEGCIFFLLFFVKSMTRGEGKQSWIYFEKPLFFRADMARLWKYNRIGPDWCL